MSIKTDRKNRRVPILSLILLIASVVIHVLSTPVYGIAKGIIEAYGMKDVFAFGSMTPAATATSIIMNLIFAPLLNPVSCIWLFLGIITLMLLFKARGVFLAIPSFLASVYSFIVGILATVYMLYVVFCGYLLQIPKGIEHFIDSFKRYIAAMAAEPSQLVTWIYVLMPFAISLCCLSLALSCIFGGIKQKAKRKGAKIALSVAIISFDVLGACMFIKSSLANLMFSAAEIIQQIIYFTDGVVAIDNGWILTYYNSYFITTIFGFIFVFANILGFAGMILLVKYLLNPYKKGKKDAEAVECTCHEHTECTCCGEGAEHECDCTDECTCEADTEIEKTLLGEEI